MFEFVFDDQQMRRWVVGEADALGEVVAQRSVCVLVGAALPGWSGVAEVHRGAELVGGGEVTRHLDALSTAARLRTNSAGCGSSKPNGASPQPDEPCLRLPVSWGLRAAGEDRDGRAGTVYEPS